jgi:6-phosphogluconolactonase/glucosamine-6-phosphate isomerase/deaminase
LTEKNLTSSKVAAMANSFRYSPSHHVPFRDVAAIERCRKIKRADIERHPNPNFRIRVLPADEIEFRWVADMFRRIKHSDDANQPVALLLPNPCPAVYRKVAHMVNLFGVNCRNVHFFAMDEYANEEGRTAPEDWPLGFMHSMLSHLYEPIEDSLRPPRSQVHGPNDKNITHYGKMISDFGGADMCYTGPGWTGHVAFIEPDAPEFDAPLEQWKRFGPRLCTLSPLTLAQNSLHGSFGMSGDIAAVPPKAATIGPAEVIGAKNRIEMAGITVHGTATAWQRLIARLCYHGPVTPRLPSSIHQQLRTDCYISELIAQDIVPDWEKGY